jgi:ADP-ribose pyrophosphatase YjhB (NUDIX family)
MSTINNITPEQLSEIKKPAASGVLTLTKDGEFLLTKRTIKAHYLPGYWSVPSGESHVNELESLEDCARREFKEETTHEIPATSKLICIDRYYADNRMYFLFLYKVPKRFFVKIDWEHDDVNWFTKENLPEPMAPQILDAIQKITYL